MYAVYEQPEPTDKKLYFNDIFLYHNLEHTLDKLEFFQDIAETFDVPQRIKLRIKTEINIKKQQLNEGGVEHG